MGAASASPWHGLGVSPRRRRRSPPATRSSGTGRVSTGATSTRTSARRACSRGSPPGARRNSVPAPGAPSLPLLRKVLLDELPHLPHRRLALGRVGERHLE